ncbi:MAG: Uma2 family endonuclease [Granulosicoccus sp.]
MSALFSVPTRHWLSVEDYHRMADVGILAPDARVELIRGEIIDMALIGTTHCGVVDFLTEKFIRTVGDAAIVRVQGAIVLNVFSELQPDLVLLKRQDDFYVRGETHPLGSEVFIVVEVAVSSEHYDREVKVPLYAEYGVPAVLLIVPEQGLYQYYSNLADGMYETCDVLTDLEAVPMGALKGLTIDLSWLQDQSFK